MRRHFLFSCLIMVLCLILVGSTWAEEKKPSGTIYIKSKSVAIGVGVTWGNGKLNYDGHTLRLLLVQNLAMPVVVLHL